METVIPASARMAAAPAASVFCEYLLVVHPDTSVYTQVMEEKNFFSARFKTPIAAATMPHITVANFLATEQMEDTIIRWMHRIISMKKSFRVTLDQYGTFKPHTIYLRVMDHQPFKQLAKDLQVVDQYIRGNGCPEMRLIDFPHLTIARRLDTTVYQEAVKVYSERNFHAAFEVQELVLLRRQHQFDGCKQVNLFRLQP